jgi:hypothetical protein
MIWMGTSGRWILPDGLSRGDRDWFAVTRDARRATTVEVVPAIKSALESPGTALVEAVIDSNERPAKHEQLKV